MKYIIRLDCEFNFDIEIVASSEESAREKFYELTKKAGELNYWEKIYLGHKIPSQHDKDVFFTEKKQ